VALLEGRLEGKYPPFYPLSAAGHKKRGNRKVPVPHRNQVFILLEVTLQQTLQSNAVAGLIAGHLQWNGGFAKEGFRVSL